MIPFVIPFVDRYPSTIDRCEDRRGYAKPSSSDAVGWAAVAARGGDRVAADGSRNVSHVGLRKDLSLSLSLPRCLEGRMIFAAEAGKKDAPQRFLLIRFDRAVNK